MGGICLCCQLFFRLNGSSSLNVAAEIWEFDCKSEFDSLAIRSNSKSTIDVPTGVSSRLLWKNGVSQRNFSELYRNCSIYAYITNELITMVKKVSEM
jgi:hypothetical protein